MFIFSGPYHTFPVIFDLTFYFPFLVNVLFMLELIRNIVSSSYFSSSLVRL